MLAWWHELCSTVIPVTVAGKLNHCEIWVTMHSSDVSCTCACIHQSGRAGDVTQYAHCEKCNTCIKITPTLGVPSSPSADDRVRAMSNEAPQNQASLRMDATAAYMPISNADSSTESSVGRIVGLAMEGPVVKAKVGAVAHRCYPEANVCPICLDVRMTCCVSSAHTLMLSKLQTSADFCYTAL